MNMKERKSASASKRLAMAVMLGLVCLLLTACYMEPDRVVDGDNGLTVGDNAQTFDTVITPTPTVTITPTPAPTSNAVDWSEWDFGADTATNPPSQVQPTTGSVVIPTQAPSIITATVGSTTTATPRPTTSTSGSTTTTGVTTLKLGSEGADVKRMQQRLKNLGYYTGSVDGDFGAGTEVAVRDFQANNGLSVDGKAGKRTLEVLYSENAKKKTATSVTAKPTASTSTGASSTTSTQNTATMYTNGKTDIYLRLGSSGSQVKILQNRLIVLGYLTGTADGEFDETTEAAVKAFQKRNNIYDDGVAGPTTLSKLYSSSAKKASSVAGHLGSLKEGAIGDSVRTLQKNLRTLGYYSGSVDGDYGAGTTAAVMAFQTARGLTADGVAGKATLNAIQAALSGGSSSSGSASTSKDSPEVYGLSASSNGYSSLSASSSSSKRNEVTALQSALSATGYYSGTVDGSYGGGTTSAVEKYQRAKGLRVTGVAGPTTQRLLYGGTSESGTYSKLQNGSSGSAVKRLQYALYELKYYDGDITGKYDTATENAVMAFQEVNGLYIDGIAGQDTQRKLFSSNAKPSTI